MDFKPRATQAEVLIFLADISLFLGIYIYLSFSPSCSHYFSSVWIPILGQGELFSLTTLLFSWESPLHYFPFDYLLYAIIRIRLGGGGAKRA